MKKMLIVAALTAASALSMFGQLTQSQIVTSLELTNQTGAIAPTPMFQFTGSLYRISMYYELIDTTTGCDTSLTVYLNWTDDKGPRTRSMGPFECPDYRAGQFSLIVHGAPNSFLTYNMGTFPMAAINYTLLIVVEQIQ